MHAKCKFACVKAINTLGMAKPCTLLGELGGMLPGPEKILYKLGNLANFESDFVLNI